MIRAAQERLAPYVRKTPILTSPFIDEIAGRRVFIKAECLQHTGSFKFRGGWSAISALDEEKRKQGVIAFSSGNHAQGVAWAAKNHGCPAVIIMPSDAPEIKIQNTKALGAEVITYDRDTESREEIGNKISQDRGLHLIRPYDDPYVIAGQGTCGLEIAEQTDLDEADVLVCCGGGGLTSGIALAVEADAPHLTVRPCEPEGFDDVARSLKTGAIQTNNRQSGSICDAIITVAPGNITFPILKRLCGDAVIVSDEDCLRAMAIAFDRLKIIIEPGGAAALAAALFHSDSERDVIVVATGGNVDRAMFKRALDTSR